MRTSLRAGAEAALLLLLLLLEVVEEADCHADWAPGQSASAAKSMTGAHTPPPPTRRPSPLFAFTHVMQCL